MVGDGATLSPEQALKRGWRRKRPRLLTGAEHLRGTALRTCEAAAKPASPDRRDAKAPLIKTRLTECNLPRPASRRRRYVHEGEGQM